jgi:hypothetical protein
VFVEFDESVDDGDKAEVCRIGAVGAPVVAGEVIGEVAGDAPIADAPAGAA